MPPIIGAAIRFMTLALAPVVHAPQAARPDALASSRKALDARLAKFRLPHVMVKFSREECYDES